MRTTPKYEFKKRELTDIADITATEDNWDKVEEELDNQDTALASHLADDAPHGIGDKSTLLTTEKSTIVGAVNELFTDVSNGKGVIASAIADMGQLATGSDTFAQLAAKIRDISKGF